MLARAPVGPVVPAMGLLPRMRMRTRLPRMRMRTRLPRMRMPVAVMPVVPRPRTPPPAVEPATATPAPVTPTPAGPVMLARAPVGPVMPAMGLLPRMRAPRRRRPMRMPVAVMPVVLRPRTPPPAVEPAMPTPAPVTPGPAGPVMLVMVPVGPVVPAMGLLPRTRPRTRPLRMRMPAGPVVLVVGLLLRMRMRGRPPRMRAPRRRRSMRMPVAVTLVVVPGLRMPMPPLVGLVVLVVRGLVRLLRVMRMVRRRRFVRMLVAVTLVVVLGLRMPMLPPMEPVMPVGVRAVRLLMRPVGLMVGVRRRLMRLVLLWPARPGWVLRGLVLLMLLVVERMPAGWVAQPRIRILVGLMVRGPGPTRARMALVAVTRLDGPATTAAPRARGPMGPGLRMRLRRTTRLILVLLVIPLLPLMPTGTDLTMTRCTTMITATVETMTIPILTSRAPVTAVRLTVTRPFPSCSKTAPVT